LGKRPDIVHNIRDGVGDLREQKRESRNRRSHRPNPENNQDSTDDATECSDRSESIRDRPQRFFRTRSVSGPRGDFDRVSDSREGVIDMRFDALLIVSERAGIAPQHAVELRKRRVHASHRGIAGGGPGDFTERCAQLRHRRIT
jgi:hypothetical protein